MPGLALTLPRSRQFALSRPPVLFFCFLLSLDLFSSLSLSRPKTLSLSLSLFADRPLLDQVDAPVGKLNSHRRRRVGTKSFFFFDFHLFFSHLSLPPLNKKNKIKKDSCVFSHPHENARRRDPRTHAYVPEPCPDYRHAGLCLLGNACPFSHGGKREGDFDFVFF